ncbi:hypothetical protein [Devosia sp.]|uniref:hypothetical protein n=1 Tax=Devosia sp. TaxID=1871048 RepID=UPI0025C65BB8|nr:hypothetical protein [Devosia sp.]
MTTNEAGQIVASWHLPYSVRLGSSVRSKGIFQFVRLRLPASARKNLTVNAGELTLKLPEDVDAEPLITAVSKALEGIEERPILPREIEDILAIKSSERHRWVKDGRLPSAGTKTVKLKGRARKITFHVFDPRVVDDLLDRDAVVEWREQDALTAAENRRRAAWNRSLARSSAKKDGGSIDGPSGGEGVPLKGWEEFERTGLLR